MQVSGLLAATGPPAKGVPLLAWSAPALRREPAGPPAAGPPVAGSGLAATTPGAMWSAMSSPKRFAVSARGPSAGVVHRELGNPALRYLPFDARQRRPNQPAMHGAVDRRDILRLRGVGRNRFRCLLRGDLASFRCFGRGNHEGRDLRSALWGDDHTGWRKRRRTCPGLLLPRRRHFRRAILVLGIACRATDLANVVIHHRHDCVIADPPLARTVVIHYFTNSKLALHH